MKLIKKYRADVWDIGNSLTRFYECVYECPLCYGEKKISGKELLDRKYNIDFDLDPDYEKAFENEDGDTDETKEGICPLCCGDGQITIYE